MAATIPTMTIATSRMAARPTPTAAVAWKCRVARGMRRPIRNTARI